jgi:hypothetical protein
MSCVVWDKEVTPTQFAAELASGGVTVTEEQLKWVNVSSLLIAYNHEPIVNQYSRCVMILYFVLLICFPSFGDGRDRGTVTNGLEKDSPPLPSWTRSLAKRQTFLYRSLFVVGVCASAVCSC